MTRTTQTTTLLAVSIALLASLDASAQTASSLVGCLDPTGSLYALTPSGQLGDGCSRGDTPVSLDSGAGTAALDQLVATITQGVLGAIVAAGIATPPACPPGQVLTSDPNGEWLCLPPALLENPNPGAKVWVVPKFEWNLLRAGADLIYFVNPGSEPARVICYAMTPNGGWADAYTEEHVVFEGSRGRCDAYRDAGNDVLVRQEGDLWLVLVSDRPVLPTALWADSQVPGGRGMSQLEAYPIDCRFPEGYERVCDLAID